MGASPPRYRGAPPPRHRAAALLRAPSPLAGDRGGGPSRGGGALRALPWAAMRRHSGYRRGSDLEPRVGIVALLRALRLRWRHAIAGRSNCCRGAGSSGSHSGPPLLARLGGAPPSQTHLWYTRLGGQVCPPFFAHFASGICAGAPSPARVRFGAARPPLMRHPGFPPAPTLGHLCGGARGGSPPLRGRSLAPLPGPRARFSAGSPRGGSGRPCFVLPVSLGRLRRRVAPPGPPALLCGAGLRPRGLGGRGPPV